ncbi:MAG: hypothetical protein OSB38_37000, partial [Paraburkholderia fungorum]|nr:hypothetical protein [Paraburkholderia fungorum]
MGNLQKVNLGALPDGAGGDDFRTALSRHNANVDILNAQATLLSGQPITTPGNLTNAAIGKRINVSLGEAGQIGLPLSTTCAADQVILLRNIGPAAALPVAQAPDVYSGPSKLLPGEALLIDTNGAGAWTVLMRGRTNSDNETVNGDLAVGGLLSVTKDATLKGKATVVGTLAVGDAGVAFPDGTSMVTAVPPPVFQCYLSQSGTGLVLSRKSGSYLTIQGIARQIPAAGVTLAATNIAANTL